MGCINQYYRTELAEFPTLLLDIAGSTSTLRDVADQSISILKHLGAHETTLYESEEDRNRLWAIRFHVAHVIADLSPDKKLMTTDVCVPISVLPEAISATRKMMDQYGVFGSLLGHVGDGNYHAVMAVDPSDEEEMERARRVCDAIVEYALRRGGTCSGEHGIGLGKKKHLAAEHGESVSMMRAIKALFDPKNILNPGKIF
ncbi:FAD-binding oxidoreductase [Cohnella faecalis]|nr:FAD-linked oxidase C-terminal domain-containing protein [Cohnella faecalis]